MYVFFDLLDYKACEVDACECKNGSINGGLFLNSGLTALC